MSDRIQEIYEAGLEPKLDILRHGLDDASAFNVEAAARHVVEFPRKPRSPPPRCKFVVGAPAGPHRQVNIACDQFVACCLCQSAAPLCVV